MCTLKFVGIWLMASYTILPGGEKGQGMVCTNLAEQPDKAGITRVEGHCESARRGDSPAQATVPRPPPKP